MPTINDLTLSIVKDVGNAEITLDYKIKWTAFEQLTNLEFDEVWKLIGDDTGQDADDLPIGDDPVSIGPIPIGKVSSNGQSSTQRTKTKTILWTNLDEDQTAPSTSDDEIRAVVTLTPRLPAVTSKESNLVTVDV